jgi:hypothetical protein
VTGAALQGRLARSCADYPVDPLAHRQPGRWHDDPLELGPIERSVKDKETVNIPVWAGVGAIVIGGALLLVGGNKG